MSYTGKITPIPSNAYIAKPIESGHNFLLNHGMEGLESSQPFVLTEDIVKITITVRVINIMASPNT